MTYLKGLCGAIFSVMLLAVMTPAQAQSTSMNHCVDVTMEVSQWNSNRENVTVQNNCGMDIFIIYCGEQEGTNRRCGDGHGSAVYYTHSNNLAPNASFQLSLHRDGEFYWGACRGTISFRNEGHFSDTPNGDFGCHR